MVSVGFETVYLGANAKDLARIVHVVQQDHGRAHFFSAGQAQFGQALGSGKLAGDELRSLLENAPYLMQQLAAGIGVTPLVGMAQALAARAAARGDVRVRMVQVARSEAELVFADVLAQTLGDRLRTVVTGAGQTLDIEAEIAALGPQAQLYVCGPAALMARVRAGEGPV